MPGIVPLNMMWIVSTGEVIETRNAYDALKEEIKTQFPILSTFGIETKTPPFSLRKLHYNFN